MALRKLPSQAFIRQCFSYDRHTGVLRWKVRPREHFKTTSRWKFFNTLYAGKVIRVRNCGYIIVTINDTKKFRAHRLIWKGMTGQDPDNEVDHIDGDPSNNRWNNLRLSTRSQGRTNSRVRVSSASGLKGVDRTPSGKFRAKIVAYGKQRYLGVFLTAEEAHAAYCRAAQELFGEFWNDGT